MKTVTPASIGGTKVAIAWPNRWLSGSRFRNRSGKKGRPYRTYFRTSRSTGTMFASRLACVISTPFGSAVAPEVKMISARSSPAGATRGGSPGGASARGASARGASARGASAPVSAASTSESRQWTVPGAGVACGASSPAITMRARTRATIRASRSADVRTSSGTTTARTRRQPQNAATHSGRFSPQRTTLSSGPQPAAARRAAKRSAPARMSA